MNRSHLRRIVGVATTTLMLASLAVSTVAAKGPIGAGNPKWLIIPTPLPQTVAPGNAAGYFVTVENFGTSNINDLTLTAKVVGFEGSEAQQTAYFSGIKYFADGNDYPTTCTDGGPLVCPLGTFPAGSKVHFTVAYDVSPTTTAKTFNVMFSLRAGTGDTGSDGNGSSRGDVYDKPAQTTIRTSNDFDGGFVVDSESKEYDTTGILGRQNKQNSSVKIADTILPVTIEDGSLVQDGNTCTIDECFGAKVGEWTRIDVPSHSGMIQVTMFIWGGNVDGGVQPGGVYALHDPDGTAGAYPIKDPCTSDAPTEECVVTTKVGNNWKLIVWLKNNGSLRGGY